MHFNKETQKRFTVIFYMRLLKQKRKKSRIASLKNESTTKRYIHKTNEKFNLVFQNKFQKLKDVITKCNSSQNMVPRPLEVPETCTGVHKIKTIFKNYFHNNIRTLIALFAVLTFACMV